MALQRGHELKKLVILCFLFQTGCPIVQVTEVHFISASVSMRMKLHHPGVLQIVLHLEPPPAEQGLFFNAPSEQAFSIPLLACSKLLSFLSFGAHNQGSQPGFQPLWFE